MKQLLQRATPLVLVAALSGCVITSASVGYSDPYYVRPYYSRPAPIYYTPPPAIIVPPPVYVAPSYPRYYYRHRHRHW